MADLKNLETKLKDAKARLKLARTDHVEQSTIDTIKSDIEDLEREIARAQHHTNKKAAVKESFALIRELLVLESGEDGGDKKKKKKRVTAGDAASVYHRDYMKTRNKPYRKDQD